LQVALSSKATDELLIKGFIGKALTRKVINGRPVARRGCGIGAEAPPF